LFLIGAPAFPAAIGIAVAGGSFMVATHSVAGNATLFDGDTVEAGAVSPEIRLFSGARVRLAANSRGTVFQDRLVLEKGAGELNSGAGFRIEAHGLRAAPQSPDTAGRVAISGARKMQALVVTGSLRVTTADGTVVALMRPGMALEFAPQAVTGAQVPFEMTGCLELRDGHFVLRDMLTGVVEEVRGDRLEREVGNLVEVTATVVPGVKPVEGAMEVIQISRMRRAGRNCAPLVPAAAAPPGQAPPAKPAPSAPSGAARGGMSAGAKAAIAGVVVGGAGGAIYYWQTHKEDETISR
jgi:hypothetical protein